MSSIIAAISARMRPSNSAPETRISIEVSPPVD
jgi:hypothetical protein